MKWFVWLILVDIVREKTEICSRLFVFQVHAEILQVLIQRLRIGIVTNRVKFGTVVACLHPVHRSRA